MANSFYTIQITDNNLAGNFLRVQVEPDGNIDKWSTTTFVVGSTSNYYECEIGTNVADTISNLKTQLDNYYIGAGEPSPVYNTTVIATDTLKVELIEPLLAFNVSLESGLELNANLVVNNSQNIKYYIEYNDSVNVLHRFELYDPNYFESYIEVQGYVTMDYGQVDENLEAIRGQGLRVNLEANANLTYDDLFSEQQKTFRVIYYRAGVILFQGWLNSEGFFEDYVNDRWIVSFDCIDGLGYLDNLAFVNPDGTNITGVKTQLEVLSLALRRTGIEQDINADVDVYYTGLADTESVLANVNVNTRRYIKDDEFTPNSCEEVIRDIIEPYGAVLTSYNGQWAIYKPNQLYSNQTATFFRYDYLGNALVPNTVTFDFSLGLGSQLNGFYPHYCNGNQQFTNKSSFGAYRISYKYGFVKSLIQNEDLFTVDGATYQDFTITNDTLITYPPPGGNGIRCDAKTVSGGLPLIFNSDVVNVSASQSFNFSLTISHLGLASGFAGTQSFRIVLVDGGTTYYYSDVNGWTTSFAGFSINLVNANSGADLVTEVNISQTPVSGDLSIFFQNPEKGASGIGQDFYVDFINVKLSSGDSNIQGEIFTFQREDNPSSRIEQTREVLTGDSNLDIYEGTLYQADGTTPTETWYRKGVTEAVPILELMGSETMRMNANTMRIFSGDVYGYFNYLSVLTIDGRDGLFGVTKYSYDTKSNIISAEFKQMFGDELTDLDVEKQLDYGNVVEPTIRG